MICRICHEYIEGRGLRYGIRHSAHYVCYMKAKGVQGFDKLPVWKLRQFPYFPAKELGLLSALEIAIAKAEGEGA